MEFILTIELRPETMESGRQVAEKLRRIADDIEDMTGPEAPSQIMSGYILDAHGDRIGEWRFIEMSQINGKIEDAAHRTEVVIDQESNKMSPQEALDFLKYLYCGLEMKINILKDEHDL